MRAGYLYLYYFNLYLVLIVISQTKLLLLLSSKIEEVIIVVYDILYLMYTYLFIVAFTLYIILVIWKKVGYNILFIYFIFINFKYIRKWYHKFWSNYSLNFFFLLNYFIFSLKKKNHFLPMKYSKILWTNSVIITKLGPLHFFSHQI